MTFRHNITFKCNCCDQEYTISSEMEMPPHWFGIQVAISDEHGLIPEHERDIFLHFCSQKCAVEHIANKEMTDRFYFVDRYNQDEGEEDEDMQLNGEE